MLDGRQTRHVKSCQFAQRGNLVELVAHSLSLFREADSNAHGARSIEVIEGVPALPGKCTRPPGRLALGGSLQAREQSLRQMSPAGQGRAAPP